MITAHYSKQIDAPKEKVYRIMLDKSTYALWTREFHPASSVTGTWEKGSKMYFTGCNEEGKREGMVSEITENIPGEIVSIKHYGILDGDKEITEGPEIEKWANTMEVYRFEEENGVTALKIAQDMDEDFKAYFDEAWERALNRLKEICEE